MAGQVGWGMGGGERLLERKGAGRKTQREEEEDESEAVSRNKLLTWSEAVSRN